MFEAPYYIKRKMGSYAKAIRDKKHVIIGFIGGSITDPRERCRWSEYVVSSIVTDHPDVIVDVENVAIGATGSDYAVLRVDEDIISRNCDIVFIEYAVNDIPLPTEIRNASREGLLRKIAQKTSADIVITYTYKEDMLPALLKHELPDTISEFEVIAEHYDVSSVFVSCYALDKVLDGTMRWEEWLPDGLHPANVGSRFYAEPVIALLKDAENSIDADIRVTVPKPLFEDNWENAVVFPLSEVKRNGYWRLYRCLDRPLVSQVLSSTCPFSSIEWEFYGTGAVVTFNFGRMSADFRVKFDDMQWQIYRFDRPEWMDDYTWLKTAVLCDHLKKGKHNITIEILPPKAINSLQKGTTFEISRIGILQN